MRNLAYFLAGFVIICLIGLTTACSMPLRKPEPYEQRTVSVDRDTGYDWEAKSKSRRSAHSGGPHKWLPA